MGNRRILVLPLFLAGCALVPQPAMVGIASRSLVEVRVNHVEGKPVPAAAPIALDAGRHTLGLLCRTADGHSFQREVTAVLAPGGRYRVEAAMEPKPCTLALVDEATGKPVGTVR